MTGLKASSANIQKVWKSLGGPFKIKGSFGYAF